MALKTWTTSIVAALAVLTAGCGDEPNGHIVAPGTPEGATERRDGLATSEAATVKAESASDQVYILIDRTCAEGPTYHYVRFASNEAEKWYRYHRGYSYVRATEASSDLRAAARGAGDEPPVVHTYDAPW